MKKFFKGARWAALLLILIGLGFYAWLHTSLPQTTGTISVNTPTGQPVTIARDQNGVPHISGKDWQDIYFAVGFAHAQDRLWQLEMNRRIGSGRLAEIVGDAGLRTDKYFRTLGFRKIAEATYKNMSGEEKVALESYAAGINSFLQSKSALSSLPPEFLLLGVTPEPWTPVDSIIWGKMMWLSLSGNYRQELSRARLMTKVTPAQVAQLYPTYPGDSEIPLPDFKEIFSALPLDAFADYVGDEKPAGYGSNNWVISGKNTKSGMPLLANDPHIGLTTPSVWYLVRLHNSSENKNVVGVTFPGSPSVVLGRNDKIAWGFTNTAPDIQDLFIEKLVDKDHYLTPNGPKPFVTRTEIIKVKDAKDLVLTVRETRHGPVMTDMLDKDKIITPDGYVMALQWTALRNRDTQIQATLGLNSATSFEDFKKLAGVYMGPEQNMIYADTKGNIGYFAPALVPIRHQDNEILGRLPSPGWLAKYDWKGFIPVEELPQRYNVESGVIATANEKIVDDNYPHFITRDWSIPYRGNRIRHLLSQRKDHDLSSMMAIQMDIVSDMARDLVQMLPQKLDGQAGDILTALKSWDGSMDKSRPEPLIFDHWLRRFTMTVLQDELGDQLEDTIRKRPYFIKNVFLADSQTSGGSDYYHLPAIQDASYAQWCDNIKTDTVVERCRDLSAAALQQVITDLSQRFGTDWRSWQWGNAHTLVQQHRPLAEVPVLNKLFQLSAPQSGGWYTINVAGNSWRDMDLNSSSFGPSYRGIFDLSNLNNSRYIITTGQSGNPLSRHFDDQFGKWLQGHYITIPTQSTVPSGADVLVLTGQSNQD